MYLVNLDDNQNRSHIVISATTMHVYIYTSCIVIFIIYENIEGFLLGILLCRSEYTSHILLTTNNELFHSMILSHQLLFIAI